MRHVSRNKCHTRCSSSEIVSFGIEANLHNLRNAIVSVHEQQDIIPFIKRLVNTIHIVLLVGFH